jgi:hypothetical protein
MSRKKKPTAERNQTKEKQDANKQPNLQILIAIIGGVCLILSATIPSLISSPLFVRLFDTATPTSSPAPTLEASFLPTTTQTSDMAQTTPSGTQYTIRFVARSIPADGELHNVYFSLDNGVEQFLFTAGVQVDHTFYPAFSRSIRVRVDVKPGTILHEELYVNGEMVASQDTDNNGLTYQVP